MTDAAAHAALRAATADAEAALAALADSPLGDRMAAALAVYTARKAAAEAATPASKRAGMAEALAGLFEQEAAEPAPTDDDADSGV